jgi:4-aminobutyrate aminotransferase-like enzyme
MNDDFELVAGPIPGRRTTEYTQALRAHESRNVTYLTNEFPVFWDVASGATVTDVDGNRYIDLTAAFGVANVGYGNPHVVEAVADQAARLMHGMGDVHPTHVKARLLERLPQILPSGLRKTFLATTGSEAVESALKTAMLATGKSAFAAFHGAYHGLSFGTLAISGIEKFRAPFAGAIVGDTLLLDYPNANAIDAATAVDAARAALATRNDLAALIVEPIQGRGGVIVPPKGYLAGLADVCRERGVLLIVDEIFTGFGRTGAWFASIDEVVLPDIICIGKAMGGGFPISAAVARAEVMDAWPVSAGEALHTSTFLGNPMGCAAALATIDEMEREALPQRARALGTVIAQRLRAFSGYRRVREVRGRGLMWGIALPDAASAERAVFDALARGVMLLQAGPRGDALSLTPPLVISDTQLHRALDILEEILQ